MPKQQLKIAVFFFFSSQCFTPKIGKNAKMYTLSLVQLCGKSSTQCKKASKKKVWEKAKKVIEVHRSQKGRHKTILTCNDMAIYAK